MAMPPALIDAIGRADTRFRVLPYGRSFDEYRRMFAFREDDSAKSIVGVADGPSSFNAEAHRCCWRVRSLDPIYAFPPAVIGSRVERVLDRMVDSVAARPDHWLWSRFPNATDLKDYRRQVLQTFLEDVPGGAQQGRYVAGGLPQLPFRSDTFDLALCSYLLFVYTDALDLTFHLNAVDELLRVAPEVRIFPVRPAAAYLDAVLSHTKRAGHSSEVAGDLANPEGVRLVLTRARR